MDFITKIASGIVVKIVEVTVGPLYRQVGYVLHYNSNLQNLKSQVESLGYSKDRMQHNVDDEVKRKRKRVERDVESWLTKVDEITQEVDVFLGDDRHEKTKCFHGFCPNPIRRYRLSRKSTKLVEKLEFLLKIEFPTVAYRVPIQDVCSIQSRDYLSFESRLSIVKEIMETLRSPDINMIGVYGIGGVGKTTLAKEVYKQATHERFFDDIVIVLDVKLIPDLEGIQKQILEKLDMEVVDGQSISLRASQLMDRIKDKKVLVILDDVPDGIDLGRVGVLSVSTCNLMLTARIRISLYSQMHTQKDIRINVLREEETWMLFEKVAGDIVKENPIRTVATEVAKKCGGLPILVVAVASALRSGTLFEWKDALRRFKKFDMKTMAEKALLTLEWSYDQLDAEELKPLFILCGIMAWNNNRINLGDCFKYSMGLGLLKNVDTMEEAHAAFHTLMKTLQNYSLVLDQQDGSNYTTVSMHELVRNVANMIARRDQHVLFKAYEDHFEEWPNKAFFEKCTMIIFFRLSYIPTFPEVPWQCQQVKLFYLDSVDQLLRVRSNFFEEMKELKVLDLSSCDLPSLPSSLQFLTNLQTLCLDRCMLGDISLIGELRDLKILSLLMSIIKQLPKEIGQLTKLQLLDLTGCSELVLIPPNVLSSLKSLEDLRMGRDSFRQWEAEEIHGSKRTNASLSELKQLSKLTALDIHIPDASFFPSGLFLHLERYHVLIGEAWEWLPFDDSFNTLKLMLATSYQLDRGLEMFVKKSEHLYLDVMEGVNNIIHILNNDGSQHLKHLQIKNSADITYFFNHNAFQSLESLSLLNLPKLVTLSSKGARAGLTTQTDEQFKNEIGCPSQIFNNGEGIELVAPAISFKNLTTLEAIGCQRLEYLILSSISQSLIQLTRLVVRDCKSLMEIVGSSSEDEAGNEIAFKRLKHLELSGLPSLQCFFLGSCNAQTTVSNQIEERKSVATVVPCFLFNEKVGFPSLETLIIDDIPLLLTIWHEQLAPDSFCKLRTVEVQRCQSLINIFGAGIMGRLNALVSLKLTQCKSLQLVFEQEGFNAKETDDASNTLEYCQNLGSVNIESCESLRNIFPASVAKGLPQLRELKVKKCDRVEDIVSKEGVGMTPPTFIFRNATYVEFQYLPQLASFYPEMHTSEWPLLEYLIVVACDNVEIFALEFSGFHVQPQLDLVGTPIKRPLFLIQKGSFYNLIYLQLLSWDVGKMKNWWSLLPAELFSKLKTLGSSGVFQYGFLQKLPHLEALLLSGFEKELFVHQRNSSGEIQAVGTLLPHLKSFNLLGMPELMDLGKKNHPLIIPNLENLVLLRCAKLKNLMSTAISYQNLQTLEVTECDELEYLLTCSMAQSLTQLTRLEVKNSQGLIEIVTNSNTDGVAVNEIAIKSLQCLELSSLPRLQSFCSGDCIVKLPSLGNLFVTDCLIELKISSEKILLSNSKSGKLKLIEEEPRDHDKPEGSGTK